MWTDVSEAAPIADWLGPALVASHGADAESDKLPSARERADDANGESTGLRERPDRRDKRPTSPAVGRNTPRRDAKSGTPRHCGGPLVGT